MRGRESEAPTTNKILIESMDSFCNNRLDCRKRLLSNYLGEYIDFECKTGCDNCQKPASSRQDLSHHISRINHILATPKQMTQRELEGQLGFITRFALPDIHRLICLLMTNGCLQLQTCLRKTGEIAEVYQVNGVYKATQLQMSLSYQQRHH
jgi:hypothetical protein